MTRTLNNPNRYLLPLFAFLLMAFNHAALAQQSLVVVKTYGQHIGGNIIYQQQVTNNGSRDVVSIAIGEDTDYQGSSLPQTKAEGELDALPVGSSMFKMIVNPASVSGPSGWTAGVTQINDNGRFFHWDSPGYPQPAIQPGQTMRFSITVPKYDEAYLTGHFSAGYADGKNPWAYNGVMEKLDTTPPSLTVSLSPNKLWPPNDKLVPVTVTITVKDDYDPMPEIKLESITASETLAAGDIQNAQFGTDDRQFSLAAKRAGTSLAGRTYTVTYSATDASGNKATTSATVTVPHDRSK
ncbi:MAG: hypothetical protein COW70_10020 [Hydrogenophilales bacterium CG18_big_fil_WC_8_21_14_2_50_58_12]|nr:MAG: hypothetical protein COW70_10020 [Hydrogenophilales bacterium CG18_big_fil_WC_8_21_14_2_50_58_12]